MIVKNQLLKNSNKKLLRCSKFFFFITLFFQYSPYLILHAQNDTTSPQLMSFDISPRLINVTSGNRVVTVSARFTDDISGVSSVYVYVNRPDGVNITAFPLSRISGNGLDGNYQGNYTFDINAPEGIWNFQIRGGDQALNSKHYTPEQLVDLGFDPTVNALYQLPSKILLSSPIQYAFNVSTSSTFNWNNSDGSNSYCLQVSSDSLFSAYVYNNNGIIDISQQIINLANNAKYFWRVRGNNNIGAGPWSDVWNFTTIVALPTKPQIVTQNNLVNQPTTFTLKWNKVKDAQKYYIELSTLQTFSTIAKSDSIAIDTVYTITGLLEGQKYYCRVQAKNVAGASPWSDVWNFITIITAPAELSIKRSGLKEVTLTWKDNSNNEEGYLIEREQNPQTSFVFIDTVRGSESKYIDMNIEQTYTYVYRTKAYTIYAESEYCNEASINVVSVEGEEIPTEYFMSQNYPNPFNPITKIKYSIPKTTYVSLIIYDLLGKEITTLVNEEKYIGNYETNFDGSNLTSGIYFYRIRAGNFMDTKKLILLK